MPGKHVHGEIITADATGSPAFILYDREGAVVTQGATERIQVDWISFAATGNINFSVFFDINDDGVVDAGEWVFRQHVGTNTSQFANLHPRPAVGPEGVALKALASAAAQTRLIFAGRLLPRRTVS